MINETIILLMPFEDCSKHRLAKHVEVLMRLTTTQEGSSVIGWFGDDDTRFDNYSKWWIPYLDYCVTNTLEAMPKYRELGARVIHAIPWTGIAVERDWSNLSERYDVSFVGRLKSDRLQYIEELRLRNILVHAFGRGEDKEGFVPFEEMIDIFWTSKINLNFGGQFGVQQQIMCVFVILMIW